MSVSQAVLLAAGLGTRLKPLTDTVPKCLVPIHGKPLLYIWLEHLHAVGFESFIINTHYLHEQVEDAVAKHPLNALVKLVYEPHLLGTAGTVKHLLAEGLCQPKDTLIAHADNFCLCDWPDFLRAFEDHREHCAALMMSFATDNPQSCGILEIDDQGWVKAFHEKVLHPPGNLANAAVYLFRQDAFLAFNALAAQENDISLHVVPRLLGSVRHWQNKRYMRDIGTPASYQLAHSETHLSWLTPTEIDSRLAT